MTSTVRAEDRVMTLTDFGLFMTAAGIWGASFLLTDVSLEAFKPSLITLLRVGFGACAIALIPAARRSVDQADYPRLALLGILWMGFPLSMFPIAQMWINSSIAGMLNSAMPIMTVLVASVVFRTRTHIVQLVGVSVGLIGIVLIGIPTATKNGTNALGVLLVVLAVLSYGFAINLAVPLQQKYGSAAVLLRVQMFALVPVAPIGLLRLGESSFTWDALFACVVLGAGGTGIAYFAMASLAGRVGAVRASVVTYVIPVVSTVLGVAFRDDEVALLAIIGTAVVLLGAWLTTRSSDRR